MNEEIRNLGHTIAEQTDGASRALELSLSEIRTTLERIADALERLLALQESAEARRLRES